MSKKVDILIPDGMESIRIRHVREEIGAGVEHVQVWGPRIYFGCANCFRTLVQIRILVHNASFYLPATTLKSNV